MASTPLDKAREAVADLSENGDQYDLALALSFLAIAEEQRTANLLTIAQIENLAVADDALRRAIKRITGES